jgi:hypothetical protein
MAANMFHPQAAWTASSSCCRATRGMLMAAQAAKWHEIQTQNCSSIGQATGTAGIYQWLYVAAWVKNDGIAAVLLPMCTSDVFSAGQHLACKAGHACKAVSTHCNAPLLTCRSWLSRARFP